MSQKDRKNLKKIIFLLENLFFFIFIFELKIVCFWVFSFESKMLGAKKSVSKGSKFSFLKNWDLKMIVSSYIFKKKNFENFRNSSNSTDFRFLPYVAKSLRDS